MAGPKIVVTHNFQRVSAMLKGLGSKRQVQQAIARSIKRTLPAVQKTAFTQIKAFKLLKLKASEIKTRARAYSVTGSNKPAEEQYGKIWVTSQGESLARFYARRIRIANKSTDRRQLGKSHFRIQVNSFGAPFLKDPDKTFMVMKGSGSILMMRISGKRLPVEKLYGPGMSELVQQTGIINTMAKVASDRYEREFESNLKFYVAAALAKGKSGK